MFSTTARFEQDANLYGTSYAKWKKQVVKDMGLQEDMNRQTLKDMTIFIAYIKNYTISMFKNTNN